MLLDKMNADMILLIKNIYLIMWLQYFIKHKTNKTFMLQSFIIKLRIVQYIL